MERPNANDDAMDIDNPTRTLADDQIRAPASAPLTGLISSELAVPAQPDPVLPKANSIPNGLLRYTVGYVYATDMLMHFKKDGHPEQPQRIRQILETLTLNGLTPKMKELPIRQVKKNEAMLVHSEDHWDKVIQLQCERSRLQTLRFFMPSPYFFPLAPFLLLLYELLN